ncbi:MAG: PIN domain-containing protein [Terracidiphilus sp.]
MTVYVLDSSALIRYLDKEAGGDRVETILKACVKGQAELHISAVQWGEVAGNLRKRFGAQEEERVLSRLLPSEVRIIPVNGERAVRAAELRVDHKLAYADCFALELAMETPDHVLVTADFGFKTVDNLAQIEFLPAK